MHREFDGSTTDLKGEGSKTSVDTPLKLRLSGPGKTADGGNYMVLGLPEQKCQVVFFYPGLRPWPDDCFEAELGTNRVRAWQLKAGYYLTNYIATNVDLPAAQAGVWLVRGKPLRHSQLKLCGELPVNVDPLYGGIQLQRDGSEFHIDATLSNVDGTTISGSFDSYKTLWEPLMVPAMLFDLAGGASKPEWLIPTLKTNVFVP